MESLKDCLPSDLKPYEFQVGGHSWEDTGIGIITLHFISSISTLIFIFGIELNFILHTFIRNK